MHLQLVAVFGRTTDAVQVAEIDLRVDALGEEVEAEGDEVHVSGALSVAEEAAFDAIGAGLVAEFGRRDGRSAVVVWMQAQQHVLAMIQAARHPFDRIRVDVRRRHLDSRGQIDDDLVVCSRLEYLEHLVADVERELELGSCVALGRVLVEDLCPRCECLGRPAQASPLQSDVDDALLVGAEHDIALQDARGVVEVNDRLLCTPDGLIGAVDQGLACLGEDLDGDVIRNQVLFDQRPNEVEVRLACARKSDLDLLVAHFDEQVEHDALALRAHRIDEGLVAVAKVDRAPHWRCGDVLGRPGAIGQIDRELLVVRAVLVRRHRRRLLSVFHQVSSSFKS